MEEINEVLGENTEISADDVKKLTYIEQVSYIIYPRPSI